MLYIKNRRINIHNKGKIINKMFNFTELKGMQKLIILNIIIFEK